VQVGRDDSALRHGRGSDLENAAHGHEMIEEGFALHGETREAVLDVVLHRARAEIAANGTRSQYLLERNADRNQVFRQIEQFAVLAVPADEPHIAIEDAEAVPDLIERGLEKVSIVLQCLRGIIEESQRRLAGYVAAPQQQ